MSFKNNDNWDKLANEQLDDLEKQDAQEKAEADKALGLDKVKT